MGNKEDEEQRLDLLEELYDLVEGIENARDFDIIGKKNIKYYSYLFKYI